MAGSGTAHLRPAEERVLAVDDLVVEFPVAGGTVHAVSGLHLDLLPGETLGILGESGCGKSSAGRALMQLPPPTSGSVRLGDVELTGLRSRAMRRARARMQLVLQDPVSALNPRRRVKDLVAEGLQIWGWGERDRATFVDELLSSVGLDPDSVRDRRPHELSGGQCQRVCIARSIAMDPDVLICDEPVSSLDVSVQAQILNLLEQARDRLGLSMVFIAHDVAVVKNISDRVLVMYLGKTCEVLPSETLEDARHPYTRLLLASLPTASDAELTAAEVPVLTRAFELPSPIDPPSGCRFRTRCPLVTERCAAEEPQLREISAGHAVACHHVED
ncbi:ABC transporter ATP-binding protein [Nocardioides marmotae]|uniref:ATP-binding cassette domain-containing protein n=1 Tax=Nocardioides marmotae TaxID=2663857 RepID=A0A6I3J054_9ACTN|nr:ABC transporter ATP-binding protein [Nocardioides marmotae]MCR6031209.1 ATP-binding cassette domain-containing protein [Gordonia jinghuaiqii]MBC9731925.1 ABC transporter ATP-binding protein [Nocardioides marmotae]MTB83045.1 ATP-binding cassette domain-containing protein [Nocardioides marmotae]MTB94847.1 ATP-binding cassette domain-containing protein [Nocardioides marmotae]QKE01169.1 ABC transporter ATP-binding protein [Nocardioides marmotae]